MRTVKYIIFKIYYIILSGAIQNFLWKRRLINKTAAEKLRLLEKPNLPLSCLMQGMIFPILHLRYCLTLINYTAAYSKY